MRGGEYMLETPPEVYIRYYQNQRGGGGGGGGGQMYVYKGDKYQRGYGIGSIFRSLIKTLTPIFTSQKFKQAASTVGRHALSTGLNIGKDLIEGANLKESLKRHGKAGLSDAYQDVVESLGDNNMQSGEGIKRKRLALKKLVSILGKTKGKRRKKRTSKAAAIATGTIRRKRSRRKRVKRKSKKSKKKGKRRIRKNKKTGKKSRGPTRKETKRPRRKQRRIKKALISPQMGGGSLTSYFIIK